MKENIMILCSALSYGGAQRSATTIATYLSNKYNILLVVIDGSNNTYGSTVPTIELGLSILNKGKGLKRIKRICDLYFKVKKIKIEHKISVCISFLPESDQVNILTKKYSKAIISIRNKRSAIRKNKIKIIIDKFVFSKSDGIVALSHGVKQDLIKKYKITSDNIKVIYNICDVNAIYNKISRDLFSPNEENWFGNGMTVINIGRLTYQKGQWYLIRAFSQVVKLYPDAKLIILGQGEYRDYLNRLIVELKIESSVCILGFKENPYIYLSKADLFVFSSLFEGLGNSLLESMACAVPIISTDCDAGPRELLAPNTDFSYQTNSIEYAKYGVLTPVFDGNKYTALEPLTNEEILFAEAIINMLIDDNLRSRYKQQSILRGSHFDADSIINQWISVIENSSVKNY